MQRKDGLPVFSLHSVPPVPCFKQGIYEVRGIYEVGTTSPTLNNVTQDRTGNGNHGTGSLPSVREHSRVGAPPSPSPRTRTLAHAKAASRSARDANRSSAAPIRDERTNRRMCRELSLASRGGNVRQTLPPSGMADTNSPGVLWRRELGERGCARGCDLEPGTVLNRNR